jgi:hypothetical protein
MKKILAASLMLAVSTAQAQWEFDNSPSRVFDMKKNITNKTTVILSYAKDIQKACEAKSRELGYGGFGYEVQACSWFFNDRCIIVVPEKTQMSTIGHEMMHCLQGHWHD